MTTIAGADRSEYLALAWQSATQQLYSAAPPTNLPEVVPSDCIFFL